MVDNNGSNTQTPSGPGQGDQPQFQAVGQYIKDLSFENPEAPRFLTNPGKNANLKIDIDVQSKKVGQDAYEVALLLEVEAHSDEGVIYKLELVYAGAFILKNLPAEAFDPILNIECPSLLFPFMRRLAADLTSEAGYPPLLLAPINFQALFVQKLEQAKAVAQKQ